MGRSCIAMHVERSIDSYDEEYIMIGPSQRDRSSLFSDGIRKLWRIEII